MDITKFNKELGKKVAMAKSLENRKEIEAAIKLWLEISEMTLNFSKSRNLKASFKNMLINRTKGIFEHIKQLKGDKSKEEVFREEIEAQEELRPELSSYEMHQDKSTISDEGEVQIKKPEENVDLNNMKVIEDSEFKNIPDGFKEVKASDGFKIITPHDKDFVQERLSQIEKSEISTQKQEQIPRQNSSSNQDRFEFDQPEDRKIMICFACGAEIAGNKKICPNCGAKIE